MQSIEKMGQLRFESPVFFCAGEPSGDVYAGHYIRSLKEDSPKAVIIGVGGACMRKSGADIVLRYEGMMAFGLSDSLTALRTNLSLYRKIARKMLSVKPKTFVAVAYPGMNLPLCRLAKRSGMKVYYMLPPQIWAWAEFRKHLLNRWVDAVISFFPFEADHYKRLGIRTILSDNLLVDSLGEYVRKNRYKRIGFMPGSRKSHVMRNLPIVLHLAHFIWRRKPDFDLCLIAYGEREARVLRSSQDLLRVVHEGRHQTMKDCDLLIISTGTASLEAAAMGIPQIFFHRLSLLDDHVLRRFVKIREYNLANLYYGEKIVPCYVSSSGNQLCRILRDAVMGYLQGESPDRLHQNSIIS
ncbi:MAG: hypothetical protein JSW49_06225 [candidate division WOR-3 bacterium]|nr:MAG: hypothetical protein JSW49_06225 [candidate division WOR-3 bacterium]